MEPCGGFVNPAPTPSVSEGCCGPGNWHFQQVQVDSLNLHHYLGEGTILFLFYSLGN